MSPEAIQGKKSLIGFGSDLWTLGVIVWQIFSDDNSTPFAAETPEGTFKNIQYHDYELPKGQHVTAEVTDLIQKLLVREPMERLGAAQISSLKQHSFFQNVCFEKLWDKDADLPPRLKKLSK